MLSKTFETGGVKATVHTETGRHVILKGLVYRKLYSDDDAEWLLRFNFVQALVQSTEVETPFIWPDVTDSADELLTACNAWLALPAAVITAWLDALREVDTPPAKPEMTPAANEKKEPIPA